MDRIGISAGTIIGAIEQNDNTRTGATSLITYEGSLNDCKLLEARARNAGASDLNIRSIGNGYWRVEAFFPFAYDGNVTDLGVVPSVHELETIVMQSPIYRSPQNQILGLNGFYIAAVKLAVDRYRAGLYTVLNTSSPPNVTNDGGTTTALADVVSMIDALNTAGYVPTNSQTLATAKANGELLWGQIVNLGLEEFIEYTSVYKRTLTAATPRQVRLAYTGVGKIWTTTEVHQFEGINPSGFFLLNPTSVWLKSRPQVTAIANQKTQVQYTYTEAMYASRFAYAAYGSATLI